MLAASCRGKPLPRELCSDSSSSSARIKHLQQAQVQVRANELRRPLSHSVALLPRAREALEPGKSPVCLANSLSTGRDRLSQKRLAYSSDWSSKSVVPVASRIVAVGP